MNQMLESSGHRYHGTISRPLYLSSHFNNNTLTTIHEQNRLSESSEIQHHMPKDLGGVSPTCALESSQTDLGTGLEFAGDNELVLVPISYGLQTTGER